MEIFSKCIVFSCNLPSQQCTSKYETHHILRAELYNKYTIRPFHLFHNLLKQSQ